MSEPPIASSPWMQVEVIVHCAANTGFHVPLEEILTTNTLGFMGLLKLAGACKNLKARFFWNLLKFKGF